MDKICDKIDHVKGQIIIYKDDEIIMMKNNMVVNSGKKFIQSMLKNALIGTINNDYAIKGDDTFVDHKLYKVYLGSTKTTNKTTYLEMTYDESANIVDGVNTDISRSLNPKDKETIITMDFVNRRLKIFVDINQTGTTNIISSIYITTAKYEDEVFNSNDETLFSRVLINNVTIDPNSSYKMEYYLYF